jgi:hypothetical protein
VGTDDVDRFARGIGVELRRFVRAAGRRRSLPFTAYAGVPGSVRTPLPHDPAHDRVLRTDLVERVVDGLSDRDLSASRACAWVTRPGQLALDTRELDWFLAGQEGFARHGHELPAFFVVSRTGWLEARSGRTRTWSRLRPG